MFEARELARAGIDNGLVFVETDHGFALGFDPGVVSAARGVVVARRRHDDLDALLWQALGRPKTYCYDYDPSRTAAQPHLERCEPAPAADTIRIEGESLWPPLEVRDGWVHPNFLPNACVSRGRGLRLHPNTQVMMVEGALPSVGRPAQIRIGWWSPEQPRLTLSWVGVGGEEHEITPTWTPIGDSCWQSSWVGPLPEQTRGGARLRATMGVLDWVELGR